jgi:GSH-dependent disulfide-bond oxidoreductase
MANQGPKLGECGHFRRAGPEAGDLTYAIRRLTDEANRLYGVMNNRLYDRRYLAGDEYTIADMISYPWTVNWQAQGQDINEFKYFKRWFEEVGNRPAVKRGMETGNNLRVDPATLTEEERVQMRRSCTTSAPSPPRHRGPPPLSPAPASARPAWRTGWRRTAMPRR